MAGLQIAKSIVNRQRPNVDRRCTSLFSGGGMIRYPSLMKGGHDLQEFQKSVAFDLVQSNGFDEAHSGSVK